MSETRDAYGPLLVQLQAEMRSLRAEMRSLRVEVRELVVARFEESETWLAGQFDRLHQRLDQSERDAEERLSRIEAALKIGRN